MPSVKEVEYRLSLLGYAPSSTGGHQIMTPVAATGRRSALLEVFDLQVSWCRWAMGTGPKERRLTHSIGFF